MENAKEAILRVFERMVSTRRTRFCSNINHPLFYKSNKRGKREDLVVRLPKLNPPNAEEIKRDKFWVEKCDYYVIKATITADPILDADKYIVVVTYMNRYEVAFIRPSKDATWTYLSTKGGVVDVLPHGGDKFYAAQNSGNLLTFSISSNSNSDAKSFECHLPLNIYTMTKYLVDNGKELLMVDKLYDYDVEEDCEFEDDEDYDKRFAYGFKFFEFNFEKCKWIEVPASNFPGLKQIGIYYNHDLHKLHNGGDLLHDFGVYDMKTKSISKPYSEHLMTLSLTNQRPIWFTPSIRL